MIFNKYTSSSEFSCNVYLLKTSKSLTVIQYKVFPTGIVAEHYLSSEEY